MLFFPFEDPGLYSSRPRFPRTGDGRREGRLARGDLFRGPVGGSYRSRLGLLSLRGFESSAWRSRSDSGMPGDRGRVGGARSGCGLLLRFRDSETLFGEVRRSRDDGLSRLSEDDFGFSAVPLSTRLRSVVCLDESRRLGDFLLDGESRRARSLLPDRDSCLAGLRLLDLLDFFRCECSLGGLLLRWRFGGGER